MPLDDRPREKVLSKGVGVLSDAELLAVLLRTGSKEKSALEMARELVDTPEKLFSLAGMKPAQLALQKGIGPAKAVTISAALELGRRVSRAAPQERQVINSAADAADIALSHLRHEDREYFLLLLLNAKSRVLHVERVFQGSLCASIAHPREVFHAALLHRAASVIVAHNHPSGDPEPSTEDFSLTRTLDKAGEVMGIPLIDHIIVGDGIYFSFQEHGYL